MRPVLRYQSQLLYRKSYNPERITRVRPNAKGITFRPSRTSVEPLATMKLALTG